MKDVKELYCAFNRQYVFSIKLGNKVFEPQSLYRVFIESFI